jgi:cysteine synthase
MMGTAEKLHKEIPNSHILDQYINPANPDAHYYDTAGEILDDFGKDLDMVVIGAGTGGTITGIAKRLKEEIPNITVVGIDPHGSILAGGDEVFDYLVEGIGYDFFPDVFDPSLVDEWVKTDDKESFLMARRLIKEEGLLVGGSSGAAVWGALQAASKLKKGQKCLVILPDNIRNYLSKFVSDEWMEEKGFLDK